MPLDFEFTVHIDTANEVNDQVRLDCAFITLPNGQPNVEIVRTGSFLSDSSGSRTVSGLIRSRTHPTVGDPFFALVVRAVEQDNSGPNLRHADRRTLDEAMSQLMLTALLNDTLPTADELKSTATQRGLASDLGDDDDLVGIDAFVSETFGVEINRTQSQPVLLPRMFFVGEGRYSMAANITPIDIEPREPPLVHRGIGVPAPVQEPPRSFLWRTATIGAKSTQDILVIPYMAKNAPEGSGYADSFADTTTRERLLKLVFGDATEPQPSLAGYFREISRGKVSLIDRSGVGVIDPQRADTITINYPSMAPEGHIIRTDVLTAATEIHDFNAYRPFDNHRGESYELTNSDVIVVILGADPIGGGGNVRPTHPDTIDLDDSSALTAKLDIVAVPEVTGLSLLVHEVLHAFGPTDMYGPFTIGWNQASILGDASRLVHLDPMHKIFFGWATPRVIDIALLTETARTEQLMAASVPIENSVDADQAEPIILWDSRVGSHEFFVIEYRNSDVGPPGHYDQGHPDWGVACWHVRLRLTDGALAPIPTHIRHVPGDIVPANDDRLLGKGWRQYDPMFAAEEDIIYGVQSNGQLMYYRHDGRSAGTALFRVGGHRTVALDNDWDTYDSITYAGKGIFWCVNNEGLTWRRVPFGSALTGNLNGTVESKVLVPGPSWATFKKIIAGDDGVIYCIKTDGTMVKYQDQGYETGAGRWANGGGEQQISSTEDWNEFRHLGYGAEGTLLGVRENGEVVQYRDLPTGLAEEVIWESQTGQPLVLIDWREYVRFFPSRDGGIMYTQKVDGALIMHEYTNGSWSTGTETVIQGPMENYISWGPDGVLDTQIPGKEPTTGHPVNLYASPDGVVAAKTGFWRPEHGEIDLRWSSGESMPVTFRVSDGSETAPTITVSFAK